MSNKIHSKASATAALLAGGTLYISVELDEHIAIMLQPHMREDEC